MHILETPVAKSKEASKSDLKLGKHYMVFMAQHLTSKGRSMLFMVAGYCLASLTGRWVCVNKRQITSTLAFRGFVVIKKFVDCSKEVSVKPLELQHVRVEHPLHFIFGKEIVVAVGIVGGNKDEEPLEYLKSTNVVDEGRGVGIPLYKRIEVGLFTQAAIIVKIGLDDAHRRCNDAAQGWCGDARSS